MHVNALKRLKAMTVFASQEVKWGPVLESPLFKVQSINFSVMFQFVLQG